MLILLVFQRACADDLKGPSAPSNHSIETLFLLADDRVGESSGLTFSTRRPGFIWTHNDSGDAANLYAFAQNGQPAGWASLSCPAQDWEAMESISAGDTDRLIVADCGDNKGRRKSISLIVLDEPDPTRVTRVTRFSQTVVRYPDRAHDCEAIAMSSDGSSVLLLTKTWLPVCRVFAVDLADLSMPGETPPTGKPGHPDRSVTARPVATLAVPMVTGASTDRRTGDLWLTSYLGAAKYPRSGTQSLAKQLSRPPQLYPLPDWQQIEAIAVDPQGGVWVSSEGKPAALGRLKLRHLQPTPPQKPTRSKQQNASEKPVRLD